MGIDMDQKEIGRFLAELRKEKHITQEELGNKLGVTNKTISRWENGNYMPDLSLIPDICQELNIGINEFISGKKLDNETFRQQADSNIMTALHEQKKQKRLLREKRFSDFFGGTGTGILISSIYSPDTIRRTIAVALGIIMVLISWYLRAQLDKHIFENKDEPDSMES